VKAHLVGARRLVRLGQVWSREIIDLLLVGFSRKGFLG
jgi:hypothetical protein